LVDMNVPKYMVASSVQVVLAQRLLRRVCESCSAAHEPTPQEVEWLESEGVERGHWGLLKHGRGCSHCNGTGYHGRMGVYEMLEMTQDLVDAAAHEDNTHFMQAARNYLKGNTLVDAALNEMKRGHTSVGEVMRISNQVED
jgi:MSHA biogenesis protein MshE